MKSETRFIIYTNDAALLALAGFPLSITKWKISSQSQQSVSIIVEEEECIIKLYVKETVISKETDSVLSIDKKLSSIPLGYTPKITELACIGEWGKTWEFKSITLHPSFTIDPSHLDIVNAIQKTWNKGISYFNDARARKEIPNAERFKLKYKRNSILQLEKVDGLAHLAQEIKILWDIRDQIILGGNDFTKTPICNVVERTQVSFRQWEYRPYSP